MVERSKLTNSSDETDIGKLIASSCIYTIPYFQRPYRWKPDKLKQLNKDILNIIDASESHFLGAIIIHGKKSNPTATKPYDIIDGQQRITTLILYLCAVVKTLCQEKSYNEAASLFLKYLVIPHASNVPSNIKLHPCKEDRNQINSIYSSLVDNKSFKEALNGFNLKLLPSTGKNRGALKNNFNSAVKFLKEQYEAEGIERIQAIYSAILESMSVVQIDVWDPTNGPKIFDALNSRQEPMTIGDLVRNEIFSKISNEDGTIVEQIDEHEWQPFYKVFKIENKNLFDSYFFPYGLTRNPNLKKSEVYNYLRGSWQDIDDPSEIILSLKEFQYAFVDIVCGSNLQNHEKVVFQKFKTLTELGRHTHFLYNYQMQSKKVE